MAIYAIGMLPLLNLNIDENRAKRIPFTDDFLGSGTFNDLKIWWQEINTHGPFIGYYPIASKYFFDRQTYLFRTGKAVICG